MGSKLDRRNIGRIGFKLLSQVIVLFVLIFHYNFWENWVRLLHHLLIVADFAIVSVLAYDIASTQVFKIYFIVVFIFKIS